MEKNYQIFHVSSLAVVTLAGKVQLIVKKRKKILNLKSVFLIQSNKFVVDYLLKGQQLINTICL